MQVLITGICAIRIIFESLFSIHHTIGPIAANRESVSNYSPLRLIVKCHHLYK